MHSSRSNTRCPARSAGRPTRPPGAPADLRRRHLTAVGQEALEEAVDIHEHYADVRAQLTDVSRQRAEAVLRANIGGASYSVIAAALDVKISTVQQLVNAARNRRAQAG